jgi:hypothetical protein
MYGVLRHVIYILYDNDCRMRLSLSREDYIVSQVFVGSLDLW